jgi:pimeloyl-ACP methyl ester carboxylesterase
MLMWGREDVVTTLRYGERLSRELPNSKLVVYPQCGHFPMIEAQSASTADLIAFLEPELVAPQQTPTASEEK